MIKSIQGKKNIYAFKVESILCTSKTIGQNAEAYKSKNQVSNYLVEHSL